MKRKRKRWWRNWVWQQNLLGGMINVFSWSRDWHLTQCLSSCERWLNLIYSTEYVLPVPWRIHKTGRRVPSNLSDTAISASLAPRLLHKFLGTRFVFGQTYVFKRLSFCYFDLSLPLTRSKLCDPRSHCACMWFRDLCSSGDLFPLIMRVYDSGL